MTALKRLLNSKDVSADLTVAIIHEPREEGMQKNGLSATPADTPPWSAQHEEKFTKRES